MNVTLARVLAARGFSVLRFDLSGLGDSEMRSDGLAPLEASMADIREVLDMLQATRNVQRVVLVGLCSGADHSVIYAGSDLRVAGVVLLDPSIPHTMGYYLRHYSSRLLRFRSWLNVVSGASPLWLALKRRAALVPAEQAHQPQRPAMDDPRVRAFLQNAYGSALKNGVQFLAVLTADVESRHNHRRQLLNAFPALTFGSQLRLEYYEDSDHTFTSETNRARVLALIEAWMLNTDFTPTTREGHHDNMTARPEDSLHDAA
jgi:pimeloyl-ACP methyl ester carboxylesterase